MKKRVMMVILGLVAVCYGDVQVNWSASSGFYIDPSMAGILGDGAGGSTIAQLIYTPDIDRDDLWAGAVNDVVWQTVNITENSAPGDFDEYAGFSSFYQQSLVSGYIYAIIYDKAVGASSYYYTPTLALTDITGILSPQGIEMNTDFVNGNAINTPNVDPTLDNTAYGTWAIPEPATFLLFGIGGFGAWLLRRRQQA